ncbi:Thioesterase domain containing protein [Parasponia andersonii]|uniref:Acyl-coenzyme A thioesterase 13 n=1 Tax=Parasponia andersonii TaxID=3476 RepID=A0A2P5B1S6_PARAD|nr:Thioesterase domain containing protein [Parasponia andersonii]
MEKVKQFLEPNQEESELISRFASPSRVDSAFYYDFALKGIRVDRVEPDLVVCTFKVPARLTDRKGRLASGAIATLVDLVSAAVVRREGLPMNVSVDMSISFLTTANVDDELEITSRTVGQIGGYFGTSVLLKNKATGELIAEGRHSMFRKHASKL